MESGVRRSAAEHLELSNVDMRRDWNLAKSNFKLMYKLVSEISWQEVLSVGKSTSLWIHFTAFFMVFLTFACLNASAQLLRADDILCGIQLT